MDAWPVLVCVYYVYLSLPEPSFDGMPRPPVSLGSCSYLIMPEPFRWALLLRLLFADLRLD